MSSEAPSWLVAPPHSASPERGDAHRGQAAPPSRPAPLRGAAEPLRDVSRDTLAANDGWAAADGGTTGGSTADDAHVFTVRNRGELVRALDGGSATPKIIQIAGTIDADTDTDTDDDGDHLNCADYATDGYSTRKYLAAHDPRTWGSAKPSGPLAEARQASAARQAERVEPAVGSNTTIVGLGDAENPAVLKGASLRLRGADNVIVRNLELRDAYDCFPVRQPNTGGLGDWKQVGAVGDVQQAVVAQVVAAEVGGFLLVRVALVAEGDVVDPDVGGDRGKLRVTLHHNEFESVVQRAPRVRFGQVHVYNNRYEVTDGHRYSPGVSTESAMYAENNAFHTPGHIEAADLVKSWNGTALHQSGTLFNGYPVDLLAICNAYNSGSERDLTADVGWTPTLHTKIDSAEAADRAVARGAGTGRIS